jgi:hypothetical protein
VKLNIKFTLALLVMAGLLAVSSAYALTLTYSDEGVLYNNAEVIQVIERMQLQEPDEFQVDPGTFFDTTHTSLFK